MLLEETETSQEGSSQAESSVNGSEAKPEESSEEGEGLLGAAIEFGVSNDDIKSPNKGPLIEQTEEEDDQAEIQYINFNEVLDAESFLVGRSGQSPRPKVRRVSVASSCATSANEPSFKGEPATEGETPIRQRHRARTDGKSFHSSTYLLAL